MIMFEYSNIEEQMSELLVLAAKCCTTGDWDQHAGWKDRITRHTRTLMMRSSEDVLDYSGIEEQDLIGS